MWEDVHNWQQISGQKFWLVPNHFVTPPTVIQSFESGNSTDVKAISFGENKNSVKRIPQAGDNDENNAEDFEFHEELQLNDIWAERFSKTLKKLKVKAMKSRNRMKWSKNRK
jgi:hypothetical protein